MTPQLTEQYGQVLRVSVVRDSLKVRTSARTFSGVKPSAARLVAPMPEADSLKNCRRENAIRTSQGTSERTPFAHRGASEGRTLMGALTVGRYRGFDGSTIPPATSSSRTSW